MERHFSSPDCLVLSVFEGPQIVSQMLLESITLKDVRDLLTAKNLQKSGSLTEDIRVRLRQVKPSVRDHSVSESILQSVRNSLPFFSILESLISVSSLPNQAKVLKLLFFVGENSYFREAVLTKLDKINVSPHLLISKDNPSQALLHLTYGRPNQCSTSPEKNSPTTVKGPSAMRSPSASNWSSTPSLLCCRSSTK